MKLTYTLTKRHDHDGSKLLVLGGLLLNQAIIAKVKKDVFFRMILIINIILILN